MQSEVVGRALVEKQLATLLGASGIQNGCLVKGEKIALTHSDWLLTRETKIS